MGEQRVSKVTDQKQMQKFVKSLLNDVQALEYMLENDWFESDIVRIGAEQEMCLVNSKTFKPAKINTKVMEKMKKYKWLDTELAQFNLETNMTPHEFIGNALHKLEDENLTNLNTIRHFAYPAEVRPRYGEPNPESTLPRVDGGFAQSIARCCL